jgi:hypothetical protein
MYRSGVEILVVLFAAMERLLVLKLLCGGRQRHHIMSSADDPALRRHRRAEEIADGVLDYLKECPNAMDTVESIAEWWIGRAQLRTDVMLLAEVLDRLTAQGVLEQVGDGDERRYRLKPGLRL